MRRAVIVPASGAGWEAVAGRLADDGVATPVLWVGDPADGRALRARHPDLDVLSAAACRAGRVPRPDYAGASGDFWTSAAHHRLRRVLPGAAAALDTAGRRRAVAGRLVGEALIAWALDRLERAAPDVLILGAPPEEPVALVLDAVFRWAGRDVVTVEPLAPWPAVRVVGPGGAVPGDGIAATPPAPGPRAPAAPGTAARPRPAPLAGLTAPVRRRIAARWAVDPDPVAVSRNVFTTDAVPPRAGPAEAALRRTARLAERLAQVSTALPARRIDVLLPPVPPPGADLFATLAAALDARPPDVPLAVREAPEVFAPAGPAWRHRAPALYAALAAFEGVIVASGGDQTAPPPLATIAFRPGDAVPALLSDGAVVLPDPGWLAGCPGVHARLPVTPPAPGTPRTWIADTLRRTAIPTPADDAALARALAVALT